MRKLGWRIVGDSNGTLQSLRGLETKGESAIYIANELLLEMSVQHTVPVDPNSINTARRRMIISYSGVICCQQSPVISYVF